MKLFFSSLTRRGLVLAAILAVVPVLLRAEDEHPDVSRIVDKAAAEAAIGEPVKTPSPRNLAGSDGYYSKCNYYSAASNKALVLRLYQAGPGFDAKKVRLHGGIAPGQQLHANAGRGLQDFSLGRFDVPRGVSVGIEERNNVGFVEAGDAAQRGDR